MEPRDVLQIYAEHDEKLETMHELEIPRGLTTGQPTLPSANARTEPQPHISLQTIRQNGTAREIPGERGRRPWTMPTQRRTPKAKETPRAQESKARTRRPTEESMPERLCPDSVMRRIQSQLCNILDKLHKDREWLPTPLPKQLLFVTRHRSKRSVREILQRLFDYYNEEDTHKPTNCESTVRMKILLIYWCRVLRLHTGDCEHLVRHILQ